MDGWGGCGCCALLLSLSAFLLGSLGLPSLSRWAFISLSRMTNQKEKKILVVSQKKSLNSAQEIKDASLLKTKVR
jgi:hypothetical protein